MAKIGYGYGSEFHLLRWMGRHRQVFDKMALSVIEKSGWKIEWIDFNFKRGEIWPDAELKGLEFLKNYDQLKKGWESFCQLAVEFTIGMQLDGYIPAKTRNFC